MELTFGEQIKIILKRKNMTIRQLAELIEMQTGRTMSRQNLTQKLNRDNFQEQDMKEIAQALGCVVQISVIDPMEATVASLQALMPPKPSKAPDETVVLSREALEREEQAYQEQENKAPSAPAAGRAREESAESDVLKEIEMALMESIQKEMSQEKEELKTPEAGPEKPEDGRLFYSGGEAGCGSVMRHWPRTRTVLPLSEAEEAPKTAVRLSGAAGNISGTYVNLYPPGIPLIIPGELITEEIIKLIETYVQQGLNIQGVEKPDGGGFSARELIIETITGRRNRI